MDNYQQSAEPEVYDDSYPPLQLHYDHLDKLYRDGNNKLKTQGEEIEKLQRMVHEQGEKINMLEKKERARLNKGHVRKGKNPFGLRSRGKKQRLFSSI